MHHAAVNMGMPTACDTARRCIIKLRRGKTMGQQFFEPLYVQCP